MLWKYIKGQQFFFLTNKTCITLGKEGKGNGELEAFKGSQPTESKLKVQSDLLYKNLV